MFKNFQKYILYFLVFNVLLYSLVNVFAMTSFQNDIEIKNLTMSECKYFIFSKNLNIEYSGVPIEFDKKDLYVFPEIENLKCLGKLGKISNIKNGYTGVVYTNTKVINLVLISFNVLIYLLRFFLKELKDLDYLIIYTIFNLGVLFNFYNSINVISMNFIFIPLLIYFLTKTENYENN